MYKHFKGISGILLVCDHAPAWYRDLYIPFTDPTSSKEYNMMRKVAGCNEESFLYSNDDFFALQDFDCWMPNYYEKTCMVRADDFPYGPYKRMYENCPGKWLNFDIHCPMIMVLAAFREAMHKYVTGPEDVVPIKTMYGNYFLTQEPRYLVDQKIKGDYSLPELKKLIKGRPFFSTTETNGTLNKAMLSLLNELYPDKSPCEAF